MGDYDVYTYQYWEVKDKKMKNNKHINLRFILCLTLSIALLTSCEREFSDEVKFAKFPSNGDVFLDGFSSGLNYFPFVDAGADPEAFSVVTDDVFAGTSAMRFDVPAFGNGFVGATFNTTANRDLSSFDALTFYAKASQAAGIDAIGFGISGETSNKYQVTVNDLSISTRWEKYIIPIPDATELVGETGLFWLAEGASFAEDEGGYILWFDEIKFEKLGTIAQPSPSIFEGQELTEQTFLGSTITVSGLTQTFNLASGVSQTVLATPSYFDFESSDVDVARVSELGEISIVGEGTATITAFLGGVLAKGSLEITSSTSLQLAPEPTLAAADVVSIFSDAYTDIDVDFYNGNFENQGTTGGVTSLGNGNVLSFVNFDEGFGFVTTQFTNPTVDLTNQNTIHFDVYIQETIDATDNLVVELVNAGPDATIEVFVDNGGGFTIPADQLETGTWVSFDIPLASFSNPTGGGNFSGGIGNRTNMGSITFASGGTLSSIIIDNIYFYTE